jgi:hypothetical protein
MAFANRPITAKEDIEVRHSSHGRFRQQVNFLRHPLLQDEQLPLSNILTAELVVPALQALRICWLDRTHSPLVTLWAFSARSRMQIIPVEHTGHHGSGSQQPWPQSTLPEFQERNPDAEGLPAMIAIQANGDFCSAYASMGLNCSHSGSFTSS